MANLKVATLAGGCFWCIESAFNTVEGVEKAVSGYEAAKMPHQPMNRFVVAVLVTLKWFR